MNLILYILLPLMAFTLVVFLTIWRARRVRDRILKEHRERQATINAMRSGASAFGGRSYRSNAA